MIFCWVFFFLLMQELLKIHIQPQFRHTGKKESSSHWSHTLHHAGNQVFPKQTKIYLKNHLSLQIFLNLFLIFVSLVACLLSFQMSIDIKTKTEAMLQKSVLDPCSLPLAVQSSCFSTGQWTIDNKSLWSYQLYSDAVKMTAAAGDQTTSLTKWEALRQVLVWFCKTELFTQW